VLCAIFCAFVVKKQTREYKENAQRKERRARFGGKYFASKGEDALIRFHPFSGLLLLYISQTFAH